MTEAVIFDTFTRGEYGDLGPRVPDEEGKGWFTGRNVLRYRNGMVGPRAGLRRMTRDPGDAWPDGPVRAMWDSDAIGVLWGGHLRKLGLAGMTLSVLKDYEDDVIPGGNTRPVQGANRFGNDWVLVPNVGMWRGNKFDTPTAGVTHLDNVPSWPDDTDQEYGLAFAFYLERLYLGQGDAGDASVARVAFSAPGNEGYWDLEDYFDLTGGGTVHAFAELRNSLVILRHGGMDLLTGSAGTSASTLRKLGNHAGVDCHANVAALESDVLVMMGRHRPYPSLFNGALWEELTHLRFDDGEVRAADDLPGYAVVGLKGASDWLILAEGGNALVEVDGTRTFHTFAGVAPFAVDKARPVVFTDGGAADAPPEFFGWHADLDRPAFVSDERAQPGDDTNVPVDAYMHLPEWWDPEGNERLVRGVVIDFVKWQTGAPGPNSFDVTVEAHNRYGSDRSVSSQTRGFSEASAEASLAGDDARVHLWFGDQGWGGGFVIKIDGIRGCAIKSVVALTQPRAPRI